MHRIVDSRLSERDIVLRKIVKMTVLLHQASATVPYRLQRYHTGGQDHDESMVPTRTATSISRGE
jgi:hypothetical protein